MATTGEDIVKELTGQGRFNEILEKKLKDVNPTPEDYRHQKDRAQRYLLEELKNAYSHGWYDCKNTLKNTLKKAIKNVTQ